MKRLTLAILLTSLLFACRKQEDIESSKTPASDKLLGKLKEYGFKDEEIADIGKYYLVQGDLLFDKEYTDFKKMEAYFGKGSKKNIGNKLQDSTGRGQQIMQAHTDYLVSGANVEKVKIYIPYGEFTDASGEWTQATREAAAHWAAISNTRINFHNFYWFSADASQADIVIRNDRGALPNNVIAAAEFPTVDGSPGFQIRVNLDFLNGYNVSYAGKLYNMVHELGHCLGLRHTNWRNGETPAHDIPGTPTSDPNSVMNGGTALSTWNGFSSYDIVAMQYLYPYSSTSINNWLTAPANKYPNDYVNLLSDSDVMPVRWNSNMVSTSTVTLKFYHMDTFRGDLAVKVPNSGEYMVPRAAVRQFFTGSTNLNEGVCQVEIVSDINPSIRDFSPYFYILFND